MSSRKFAFDFGLLMLNRRPGKESGAMPSVETVNAPSRAVSGRNSGVGRVIANS